jgi:uncharacterized protein (UPF0147 family)
MMSEPRRNRRLNQPTTAAEVLWSIASDENMPPNVRCRAAEAMLLAEWRNRKSAPPSAADAALDARNRLDERTRQLMEAARGRPN